MQKEGGSEEAQTELSERERTQIIEYLNYREQKQEVAAKEGRVCRMDVTKYEKMRGIASRAICVGDAYTILRSEVQEQL